MDEIKTNPPVQNSPAEPPKKVRRVGTMAFAVLLIAGAYLLGLGILLGLLFLIWKP